MTEILAIQKINIKQAYASDPNLDPVPHITTITNELVDGRLIQLLLKIDDVSKVSLIKNNTFYFF